MRIAKVKREEKVSFNTTQDIEMTQGQMIATERPAVARPTVESSQNPYPTISPTTRQLNRGNSIGLDI